MALINRPMYEHFGARHLGVKGPGALTNLEEGVMGVLPLDLSSDPMYWYIQGIRVFSANWYTAASAGDYGKIGLSVETDTQQIIARILGVWVRTPTSTSDLGIYRCARTAFSSDPGRKGHSTDTRIPEAQESQATVISSADTAYPGTELGQIEPGINQFLPMEMPLIITPEQCIYFINWTANEELQLSIVWVEMPAYKAEL
jgi:hypothetical protein